MLPTNLQPHVDVETTAVMCGLNQL